MFRSLPQHVVETRLSIKTRGFSNGSPIDAIETEKSRIILHELEPGWWILAVRKTLPASLTSLISFCSQLV